MNIVGKTKKYFEGRIRIYVPISNSITAEIDFLRGFGNGNSYPIFLQSPNTQPPNIKEKNNLVYKEFKPSTEG
jgi:hypothetical protein